MATKYGPKLPKHMRADYERARNDDALLSMREEIAVLDARIQALLSNVDAGESGALWKELRAQNKRVKDIRRRQREPGDEAGRRADAVEMAEAMQAIDRMIETGYADWAIWSDIQDVIRLRETVVRSERRYLVEQQLVISVESAQLLMAMLTEAVINHVTDRPTLNAVMETFVRLSGRPDLVTSVGPDGNVVAELEATARGRR